MRTLISRLSTSLVCLISGCGTTLSSQPTLPIASHGGTMVALPGGHGFLEIKTEGDEKSRNSRNPERRLQIVAFFYQADGTTPTSPAPTDVRVKVGTNEKSPIVPLSSGSTGGGPDPNRFESTPGPYPEGFQGQLDAKLNGEPIQVTFLFR